MPGLANIALFRVQFSEDIKSVSFLCNKNDEDSLDGAIATK